MKKITLLVILCLFTVTAQAKEKLGIVFAGSLGGSFNKFNSALVKDLSKWYDIEEFSTGGSSTKGGKIFSSINDRPVFMMSETAKRNVVNAIKGKGPFVNGLNFWHRSGLYLLPYISLLLRVAMWAYIGALLRLR